MKNKTILFFMIIMFCRQVVSSENGVLFYNTLNGFYGLGTETPQTFLHIKNPNPILTLQSTSAGGVIDGGGSDNGWAGILFQAPVVSNGTPVSRWGWLYSAKNRNLSLWDYAKNAPVQTFMDGGNIAFQHTRIGINTSTPEKELDVNGIIQSKGLVVNDGGILLLEANRFPQGVGINTSWTGGWDRAFSFIRSEKEKVFMLGATGTGDLCDYGYIATSNARVNPIMAFSAQNGFVGVGTVRPQVKLDVEGALHVGYDPEDNFYGKVSFHHSHQRVGSQYYSGLVYSNASGALSQFCARFGFYYWDRAGFGTGFYSGHWDEQKSAYTRKPDMYISGLGIVQVGTDSAPIGNYSFYVSGNSQLMGHLRVSGSVMSESIAYRVTTWADKVFEPSYSLMPLNEVAEYIENHRHLPGVPQQSKIIGSEQSVEKIQVLLLQKIEELTLYAIQQEKRIQALEKKVAVLKTGSTKVSK
jgi:hypothetical protein